MFFRTLHAIRGSFSCIAVYMSMLKGHRKLTVRPSTQKYEVITTNAKSIKVKASIKLSVYIFFNDEKVMNRKKII